MNKDASDILDTKNELVVEEHQTTASPRFYESPYNREMERTLKGLFEKHEVIFKEMDTIEVASILSLYVKKALEYGLRHYKKEEEIERQLEIANSIIQIIKQMTADDDLDDWELIESKILRAIVQKPTNVKEINNSIPETSLSKSSLFTGSQREPMVYHELKKEIATADRVSLLVSFIKHSGLRLIYEDLKEHTRTKPLRIITTSYMGATDAKAIKILSDLPNTEIKISYDTQRTRLHAKAYYFERDTGFSTAYIGSSNLSKAALSEGTEWNVKLTEYSSPELIEKFKITFDTYWHMAEFEAYDGESEIDQKRLEEALQAESNTSDFDPAYFDLKPYAFQQDILEQIEIEREVHNSHKNLIVAATGTGKTMVAAFDFKRLYRENPSIKLLFIAHREEILKQSLKTFRGVLKDNGFGELWVSGFKPNHYQHVFASTQTLNSSAQYSKFQSNHFDVVVFDETHHIQAKSYQSLVEYFEPKVLLGLTATPERMDGKSILPDFNDRIAYEIRLNQAIEQNLLCPFHYFGITDDVDLSQVKFQSGQYDTEELGQIFIKDYHRDRGIVDAVDRYVSDLEKTKGLGFCVNQDHAKHMASVFEKAGIPSESLDANSNKATRDTIQGRLKSGKIKFIFVVDLYNEGIDLPYVNTVLFLRPTKSATIFIQQLGRGLRLHEDKEVLTVLDFIGQAHKDYDYRMKFQKIAGRTHRSVSEEIKLDFPSVPRNCFIHLERLAKDYVLRNLNQGSINLNKLRRLIVAYATDAHRPLTLRNFLRYFDLTAKELYYTRCLFQLKNESILWEEKSPILKGVNLPLRFYQISQIDDIGLLQFGIKYLESRDFIPQGELSVMDQRRFIMLYYTLNDSVPQWPIHEYFYQLSISAFEVYQEILEVLHYALDQTNHLPKMINLVDIPLEIHASYNTHQVFSAIGINNEKNREPFREGVKYSKEENLDLFFITLKKSAKQFTETTMYEDYAIDEELFHWQSQSRTSINSPTGQRYVNQNHNGSKVILFVREGKTDENNKSQTYICLGLADYVSHKGSAPISIIYRLREKMPVRVLRISNDFVEVG